MSDDIREVMRPTPFSPLKRVERSGDHKSNSEGYAGGWAQEDGSEQEGEAPGEETLNRLAREVDAANERLQTAGKKVRLRLAAEDGIAHIEIILPGESGASVVSRRIAASEIQEWVLRLETAEGLMIDEML